MKIKNILLISFIIGISVLIFLVVLNTRKNKNYNVLPINDVIKTPIDNVQNKKANSIKDNENNNHNNVIDNVDGNSKKKSENVAGKNVISESESDDNILVKNPYYYQPNWIAEEVVVSEEKEKLSFFDKIDGKKAKVTKKTKIAYKWLKSLNDEDSYVKNAFVLVPVSTGSDIAYKYYFDNNGYLITDNISKDYSVLDNLGREINQELKPVEYYIGNKNFSVEHIEKPNDSKEDVYYASKNRSINSTPSQVIITDGVVFRNKLEKIFNTLIDRDMIKYIVGGSGYQKNTKCTIYTKTKWEDVLKLRSNGSYVVINNHINNFNKITGKVAVEYTISSDRETRCRIVVYDKNEYDKGNLDECLFETTDFNYSGIVPFSFTFDRSIKDIVIVLYVTGTYKNRSVYFKDLRFGFSKSAYIEELVRKREDQEEIDYLKSLGLYVEDDSYFDIIDEDGEILDEIDEEIEDIEELFDSNKYYYELMDKKSGPAFDEELKKLSERKIGPYYDIVGTKSEIKDRKRKSKTIYIE